MKKIAINLNKTVTRSFPENTKLLCHEKGWVTWFDEDKKNIITIYTCPEEDFECDNDTQKIQIRRSELRMLIKELKIK